MSGKTTECFKNVFPLGIRNDTQNSSQGSVSIYTAFFICTSLYRKWHTLACRHSRAQYDSL